MSNRYFYVIALITIFMAVSANAQMNKEPTHKPNCAAFVIDTGTNISGATFIITGKNPSTVYLALAHGDGGASIYNAAGTRIWTHSDRADVVSSFNDTLLIYRKIDDTTQLEKFQISPEGTVTFVEKQSPSDIAATTLQRNAYASLGPVRLQETGVLVNDSFVELSAKPSAVAATRSQFNDTLDGGAVAFGLENGTVLIRPMKNINLECH